MLKGIDISYAQSDVDYKKLSENVDFVIIRCGFGKDKSQKDSRFEKHYKNLKKYGVKVGCYLYSYATNLNSGLEEAKNCYNLIKGKTFELPVFYDLEDKLSSNLEKEDLTKIALDFCEYITNKGYDAGVYANKDWWTNKLIYSNLKDYYVWVAQWNNELTVSFKEDVDFWQYSNKGKIKGITGNVDLNYYYVENVDKIVENLKKSNEEIANEVIAGIWGNGITRKNKIKKAGYNYDAIQKLVNEKMSKKKSNEVIANEVIAGKWGNGKARKLALQANGYDYEAIQKLVNKKMR